MNPFSILDGLAEAVLFLDPGSALTRLRDFAEEVTRTIYHLERLPRLPQASFYDLLKDSVLTGCVSRALLDQLHFLRVQGNDTAHGGKGDARSAHVALQHSERLAPPTQPEATQCQAASQQVATSLHWNEAQTRALLIDVMLQKAGWDVGNPAQVSVEFVVHYPDNVSGKGRADYVLWGDNGQPLAVIEAKKSGNKSLQAGREQARLYADALENMGYQRPVIFYTNGYETFIWDDHQYNTYRPVYGFYSKNSLDYLIYQRHYRVAALEENNPDLSIVDRPYQIEAIKTVAVHFQQQRRKALIIQVTGTGKTRVAIALAELLFRTGWAKRVLFLCDRKEKCAALHCVTVHELATARA